MTLLIPQLFWLLFYLPMIPILFLLCHKNLNELINTLNVELTQVLSWFKCNKLLLNLGKTNFMHFQTTNINVNLPCNIKTDNLPLVQKDNFKNF